MNDKIEGTVKFFDSAKGWGFINSDDDLDLDIFVHYKDINADGYKNLTEGERVIFTKAKTDKGWSAKEVTRL